METVPQIKRLWSQERSSGWKPPEARCHCNFEPANLYMTKEVYREYPSVKCGFLVTKCSRPKASRDLSTRIQIND
ncbi:hypothetical protein J6590_004868 [Homalodisca vitripennis]|nr:hypothetical protein J6590_004868 [Homalodisca vitripennis]